MRRVLALGATSAIVAETLRCFAADGDSLMLVGRSLEKLERVALDLKAHGASAVHSIAADLADSAAHRGLFVEIEKLFPTFDTVIIGYGSLPDQKICQREASLAEQAIRTNFLSAVSLLTVLANCLEGRVGSVIAVITSVAGDRGRQSNYVYGCAKAGLSVFLQGLRNRLSCQGVCVLTIKPGFVDTPMTGGLKKGLLFASPESVGRGIYNAICRRRDVVYLPWYWCIIMLIIRHIPEPIFKRLKL